MVSLKFVLLALVVLCLSSAFAVQASQRSRAFQQALTRDYASSTRVDQFNGDSERSEFVEVEGEIQQEQEADDLTALQKAFDDADAAADKAEANVQKAIDLSTSTRKTMDRPGKQSLKDAGKVAKDAVAAEEKARAAFLEAQFTANVAEVALSYAKRLQELNTPTKPPTPAPTVAMTESQRQFAAVKAAKAAAAKAKLLEMQVNGNPTVDKMNAEMAKTKATAKQASALLSFSKQIDWLLTASRQNLNKQQAKAKVAADDAYDAVEEFNKAIIQSKNADIDYVLATRR